MSSKLVVLYQKPRDPVHFDRHFREVHMPLVVKMPGLRSFAYGPASDLQGKDGAFFWSFVGTFDSRTAITDALGTPEGQKVVADIPNYSPEAPGILHVDATDG